MLAKHCTIEMMDKALAIINKKYLKNIRFYEIEQRGKNIKFRLKTNSSTLPGGAKSYSGHRTGSGCWHVHGDFFEALLKINPEAIIVTKISTISKNGGNWINVNDASDACDCEFSISILGNPTGTEKDFITYIKNLNVTEIFNLISDWGYQYGKFILTHCIEEVLPLHINDDKFKAIVIKRLNKKR